MGRKKPNAAGGILTLLLLSLASLVLFTFYVREDETGPLHTVQLGAAEVLQPVRGLTGAVAGPLNSAKDSVEGAFAKGEEIERLREEVRKNQELAAQASRLQRENDGLRELLNGQRTFYTYGPLAEVVAPVGGQFTDRITINVGAEDGVGPQQPVVVGNNTLVGRTTSKVTDHTAEVMLVTDRNFRAGVRIVPPAEFDPTSGELLPAVTGEDTSYGEGLLQTGWENYLGVGFVDLDARTEKGDFVVTSGRAGDLESLFPPGLLIGTVESASSQDIEQYKKIVVDPAVNLDNLGDVRVIVDW
ncbi:MAG: rod shape-determining protein MreC [Actinomycetota bacterium]|nr:rod shape-determining protein MreC [Actinomycetota bacterium]